MSRLLEIGSFLQSELGLTPAQAAGVLGNFKREAGEDLATNRNEGGAMGLPSGRGGYGLAQWTGPRQQALINFAGTPQRAADLNTQLQFLKHELTGPESRALANLRKTQTPEEAAFVFDRDFERSGVKAIPQRQEFARRAFAALNGQSVSQSAPAPAPAAAASGGSRSLTDALVENLTRSTLAEMGMPGSRRQRSPQGGGSVGGDSLARPRSFTDALVANLTLSTLGDFGAQALGPGGLASGAGSRPRRMAGGMQADGEAVPGLPDISSLVMSALFPSRAAAAQTTTAPVQQQAAMPTAALSGRRVSIVDAGKLLQQSGLRVQEHPEFGGVGKHSPGSYHDDGRALDVTDWQDPGESERSWKPRKAWMAQQIETALKPHGAEVFGPHNDSGGHGTHIHIGLPSGSLPAEAAEQLQRIRAEGLKRYPLRWAD